MRRGASIAGRQEKLESYTIFGKPVVAVADAMVASVIDGLPEQTPGNIPRIFRWMRRMGTSVILDLGEQRYAMYAHMQPGTHSGPRRPERQVRVS